MWAGNRMDSGQIHGIRKGKRTCQAILLDSMFEVFADSPETRADSASKQTAGKGNIMPCYDAFYV